MRCASKYLLDVSLAVLSLLLKGATDTSLDDDRRLACGRGLTGVTVLYRKVIVQYCSRQ
jgi:hypothetical protein